MNTIVHAASAKKTGRQSGTLSVVVLLLALTGSLLSCDLFEEGVAELWTDIPEFAFYAAKFNNSQDMYKIHVSYVENIPQAVQRSERKPALLAGTFLKSTILRPHLQQLDYLFSELKLSERQFYPTLFGTGRVEDKQLLLPVSFNLPMVIFQAADDKNRQNNFIISRQEIMDTAGSFDTKRGESYTKMGFSPRWNPEFLLSAVQLEGASFREGDPVRWDKIGLESAIAGLRKMISESHSSAQAEDDFKFRYLYIPEYKAVQEGRARFAWMNSASFFLLPEEQRSQLAFRWLGQAESIRLEDSTVFAGMCRTASGKDAAEAFLKWFYSEDTQRSLLQEARETRLMENSFGIAGGFSALRVINEKAFPDYYPSLLGKLPPAEYLQPAQGLPAGWPDIKKNVLLPFLLQATGDKPPEDLFGALESAMRTWGRQHSY
ncbi:MAG: hypothetical protein KKI09_16270 [Spirochaetes bacterium]|nr:hypothetical protein [Spirochaetota bacterium]MBU0956979.1 hypothetical protein [Spirochaetota bacterium]